MPDLASGVDVVASGVDANAVVETQPIVESSTSSNDFVSQFSQQLGFEVPQELSTPDALAAHLEKMQTRAALADDYESRLAQQSQAMAEYEQWKASQSQQQQEPNRASLPGSAENAAQKEAERRWLMQQTVDTRYLEQDPSTGLYKAPHGFPELHAKADQANKVLLKRQQFTEELLSNPYDFMEELAAPALSKVESKLLERIAALEQQLTPVMQHAQASTLQAFEWQNKDLLYQADPNDPSALAWSPVGELYQDFMSLGADPRTALEMAKARSSVVSTQQVVSQSQTPEQASQAVKSNWLKRAKQVSRDTGQPTQSAGTIATALQTNGNQTTRKLTGRALYQQLAKEAENELMESGQ